VVTTLLRGKRVVFVLAGEVLGGAERSSLELARDLYAKHGAVVEICALDDRRGRAREVASEYGIAWSCVPTPWVGRRSAKGGSLLRLTYRLRRRQPDVLIAATNLPNVVCGLTWRAAGASLAVWNQHDVNGSTRISGRMFRRALHATPIVVTGAYHARDWLVESFGVDRERVHVIRDKVELPPAVETGSSWRSRLGIGPDDFVACMLAQFHSGKDHATLLRAWRLVVDGLMPEGPRPVLVLAGRDAGTADAAKALAFDLDLGRYVRFVGEVSDVSGLLDSADAAVFSSHRELLGRGATEPMAAGLPVVGTDLPGIREAVGEPGVPFLAAPGDARALAQTILRLATDPGLRARVGRANTELIRMRQSGEETSEVYAELLARRLAMGSGP
jgi:glycosyltransferase involved in cell wall biosynthesis